jgi:hypothetical protein
MTRDDDESTSGHEVDRLELTILVRPSELAALIALLRPAPVEAPVEQTTPVGPLTKNELAKALRTSIATVDRLVREGMPSEIVGTRRRFDLAPCRAWLAARGRKPTSKRRATDEDPIDVTRVVRRAGLRVVREGSR